MKGCSSTWFQTLSSSAFALAGAVLLGGCASAEKEVQKAARDWCMTIRGSQVIPVYPLTEDIQPGDIFLVSVPVDQQQKIYNEKGFLPLDNHLARLDPVGYPPFYDNSFLTNNSAVLPRDWIRPDGGGLYAGTNGTNTRSWQPAPYAAFPSYSFSVQNGGGMSMAVPLSGIPVGLSLMGSDAASGNITIKNAHTMGVDIRSLYEQLKSWSATNGDFLRPFATAESLHKTNYLRVVTRVYAAGGMNVSLQNAASRSGGLDVGAPKLVNLLSTTLPTGGSNTTSAVLQNYTNAYAAVSQMVSNASSVTNALGQMIPGGSLRLVAASARNVSLDETFDPPLIFGYLGFDCVIMPGGRVGPPVATHAVIDRRFNLGHLLGSGARQRIYQEAVLGSVYRFLQGIASSNQLAALNVGKLDALAKYIPTNFVRYTTLTNSPSNYVLLAQTADEGGLFPSDASGYENYQSWIGYLDVSINALGNALKQPQVQLVKGKRDAPAVPADRAALSQAYADYQALSANSAREAEVKGVTDRALFYYINVITQ